MTTFVHGNLYMWYDRFQCVFHFILRHRARGVLRFVQCDLHLLDAAFIILDTTPAGF